MRKLWIGLIALIILSPLGLIVPARFGAGSAWGEWSADELDKMLGYMPDGMAGVSNLWKAPMADYAIEGRSAGFSYLVSALVGVIVVVALTLLLGRALARREDEDAP